MGAAVGSEPPSVLLVDDERAVLDMLAENLVADRFAVVRATSGEEALSVLRRARVDAAIVDVVMPGMGGLDLVSAIREAGSDAAWDNGMPILMLSGRRDPHDAVRGIERGADDYVAKPFHYPEVLARLGALLRRARGLTVAASVRVGPLTVERHSRRAIVNGCGVNLSAKEFELLLALARDPHRVVGKDELLRDVWGYLGRARTRTVDSHASRLRRKLAGAGAGERWVHNVWGVGYRLLPDDA
ncbi:MAG: two-component system, OmpR family, phosphate regulon response regulator PhoB [Miltoncostaeaceae bacterium]|jgi:DNA-binding response OmpR family regulator|nr:two-component system, OmpR family, phosphate regulon response regulator PhoB [Miltoncostaeaceae bacterium]